MWCCCVCRCLLFVVNGRCLSAFVVLVIDCCLLCRVLCVASYVLSVRCVLFVCCILFVGVWWLRVVC